MDEKAHWEFEKERSLTDNLECLSQGLRMLAFSLGNLADPALEDTSYELSIHPYTLLLHSEAAKSMAGQVQKMMDGTMNNPGPGKLVPFERSDLKTEDEAKEECDGKE